MVSLRFWSVLIPLGLTAACGGYGEPTQPSPAPSGPSARVSIQAGAAALAGRAFDPGIADVAVGTTVTWTNDDAVAHTSTSDDPRWNSGSVAPGGRYSFTFGTTGTFAYHCSIHPGMVGTVTVH